MALPRGFLPTLALLLGAVSVSGGCSATVEPVAAPPEPTREWQQPAGVTPAVTYYSYEVVNAYPHDERAFTEGLTFEDGFLYEGTGLRGASSLRKVALETGAAVASVALSDDYFGEGVVVCGDRIVQLTWKSRVGFVYDRNDFRLLRDFSFATEGWGITFDGSRLIMSDGTSTLYFLDPETFEVEGRVDVRDRGAALTGLNELEFIDGLVYANVWPTDRVAMIDPGDGRVTGWLDLSGLLAFRPTTGRVDVLNGIACDAAGDRLFVTGKWWPWLFEIKLVRD